MLTTIVSDWGQVLIHMAYDFVHSRIKEGPEPIDAMHKILEELDTAQISEMDACDYFNRYCFKKPVKFSEFVHGYTHVWRGVNNKLFIYLQDLKKRGAHLVAVTDISKMSYLSIVERFPKVIDLFTPSGETKPHIITSFDLNSLKTQGTPFVRACSEFGFSPNEAAVIDDKEKVLEVASNLGLTRLPYNIKSAGSHALLEIYLNFYFPPP